MAPERSGAAQEAPSRTWAQGLYTSATGNAQAFGFSITVTVTFGAVSTTVGPPSKVDLMAFSFAAVAAFSLLNAALALAFDVGQPARESTRVVLLATATDFVAVGAGVGSALGWAALLHGWAAWVVAPFSAGLLYVLVQAVELAAGRRREMARRRDA